MRHISNSACIGKVLCVLTLIIRLLIQKLPVLGKPTLEFYYSELSYSWSQQCESTTKDWLWVDVLHSSLIEVLCFTIRGAHPYSSPVYSLMSGRGIILESHKKPKVFVIAPGSKHTAGRCWKTVLHPLCQNTSALSLPWPWSWTSPRQPLPTQQAVWWLGVLGTEIVRWMLRLCLTTGTFHKACGIRAVDLKAHCMMAR